MMKIINRIHTGLAVIISLQVLFWSIGGFFMYYLDFSDLYSSIKPPELKLTDYKLGYSEIEKVIKTKYPESAVTAVTLKQINKEPYYLAATDKKPYKFLITNDGFIIEKLEEEEIKQIAETNNEKKAEIEKIEYLETSEGNYFSSSPLYKVSFADEQRTEYYISPQTGELLAKRKALWGFYNRMWELHLMKFTGNKDFNKMLLLITAWLNVIVVLTGLIKFVVFLKNRKTVL